MSNNHVVIDLETFDTAITAAFVSIGAVRINILSGKVLDNFYVNINFNQAKAYGTISKSTMDWWASQPKETRALLKVNQQPLIKAMYDFACWLNPNDRVWGNGALFDIGILEHYYNSTNTRPPWKFWNVRDVRTVVEIGEKLFNFKKDEIPFVGTPHYAIDDALHEAKLISHVIQLIAKARG